MPLRVDQQYGDARINGASGTFVYLIGGIRSIVRTGIGVYEISLDPGANSLQHVPRMQVLRADGSLVTLSLEWPTALLVRVRSAAIV